MKPRQTVLCLVLVCTTLLGQAHGARIGLEGLQTSHSHEQHPSSQQAQQLAGQEHPLSDYYHYQDELALSSNSNPANALAPEELQQRNAYLVEDPQTGRTAVIEKEDRPLPGGGHLSWTRKTAPGFEFVTAVISSSSRDRPAGGNAEQAAAMANSAADTARSSWGLAQQLSQRMFGGAFNNALLGPLNDMLDALDAQQQRLGSMLVSRHAHAAAAAAAAAAAHPHHHAMPRQHAAISQQQPHMHHGVRHSMHNHHAGSVPCPRHQALIAAAAAAADAHATAHHHHNHHHQQQQHQLDGEVQDLETLWSQQAHQQREQARAQAEQQLLQEQLAAAGLALSAQGAVVPLLLQPLPEQQQQGEGDAASDAAYDDYGAAAAAAAKLEALYDTTDGDYAFTPASLDGVIPRLDDARGGGSSSSSVFDGLDVDLALLVLLVAATAGMCMAFLQSLLQLREALYAQQQPQHVLHSGKPLVIVAGGRNIVSNTVTKSDSSEDELTQPLLVSPRDSECAQEQQQQQQQQQQGAATAAGSGVQRFYNPLCYQQLPGGGQL